ncbi:formate/nitrite transporter family protein [Petroclostridium sp. X23]|uniref:formate/nitrite transporter family protein n=1 Tax=Petroclostridium sp. X23 TaxID=3045146 RepID=UPI0024AE531A|nr:formate/nitrite transporter family protein [Petroclostridium sp. X23]WHH59524.1 formate/nitrite transporter family protein [Petroclostridium sp. X23]
MNNYLPPEQIAEKTLEIGIAKADNSLNKSFLLGVMGGIFIALAAFGSIVATATISNYSIAVLIAGIVFSTGLMMVVVAGGDLYTGNVLMIISVLKKRTTVIRMILNLVTVFLGNLAGSIIIVLIVNYSGLLESANGMIVGKILTKAVHKVEYPFHQAFLLGILCNLLVCIAVWMMYSAKDTAGKILTCFFPIMLFILSGYEHIVANMYYIPAGILASWNMNYIDISGLAKDELLHLTVGAIPNNFIPVILGNLVGGLIIGTIYHSIYLRNDIKQPKTKLKMSA